MSILADLGIERDQRDFVGRWHVVATSDEYTHTARRIVHMLQEAASLGLKQPSNHSLGAAGVEELLDFLSERGQSCEAVAAQNACLCFGLSSAFDETTHGPLS